MPLNDSLCVYISLCYEFFFLASICFQIQLPVSYRYLKGLSPRSSERDAVSRPRRRHQEKRTTYVAKQQWLDCLLDMSSKAWVMVYKIKSLGLLGHVSFRMHYCTSTSCLSNGSSCRDLPCLSFVITSLKDGRLRQKSTHLKVNFLLICFQQLFAPDIATQRLPLAE